MKKREVEREIDKITFQLVKKYKPEKIILFGSAAKGNHRENSDIDLLIIKNSKKRRAFRVKEIFEALRGISRNFPLDPIVYTPAELKKRVRLGDFFIKNILAEGQVLYG